MTQLFPYKSSGQAYGGTGKINDQYNPPAILSKQWDNPSLGQAVCQIAAIGLCAPCVLVRFTLATTTSGLVLVQSWSGYQNATDTLPVLVRTGTGVFTITLPVSVSDEYDASFGTTLNNTVNLTGGVGNIEGTTLGTEIHVTPIAANVLQVVTGLSGSANDLAGTNVFVVGF